MKRWLRYIDIVIKGKKIQKKIVSGYHSWVRMMKKWTLEGLSDMIHCLTGGVPKLNEAAVWLYWLIKDKFHADHMAYM